MIDRISKILDILLIPFAIPSAIILKFIRRVGLHRLPFLRKILIKIGIIPVINHYYDPFFSKKDLQKPLIEERNLPGIDWNIEEQLNLLNSFNYSNEFKNIPNNYKDDLSFHFDNHSFCSGDAEYWYNIIRLKQPKRNYRNWFWSLNKNGSKSNFKKSRIRFNI